MSLIGILETLLIGPLKLAFEIIFQYSLKIVGHPGFAIVVLSLVMNILVLPLYKRADAMQEQARDVENKLREGTAHIKKTFSGDERMMMLQTYNRQNNYKPTDVFKGSVSLLLEIPFFMAAYQFLSHLETLNGISFGPITDLGKPDALLVIGGITLNALPIIMTLINVISSAIYLKGFPLKTKIQLYGMAAFFLVFLYTSPAGLLFYWTLNNVFSLVKNIFYKIKNPKLVISILSFVIGLAFFGLAIFSPYTKRPFIVLGAVLILPLISMISKKIFKFKPREFTAKPNKNIFVLGALFLTVFIGVFIPSTYIAASPQEYVDISYFHNPLWYIVSTATMAAGFFLVWFRVFYWLAQPKLQVWFERLVWILSGLVVVNYMFFGTKLGIISSELVYENGMFFEKSEMLLNIAVWALVGVVLLFVAIKWRKVVSGVLLTAAIAIGAMSGMNIYKSSELINKVSVEQSSVVPNFTLSKEGKNVIVLMLDRAVGGFIPFMFDEKPELREQFEGFTFYENALSHGGFTNFGTPGLFGGYEYTPVEMNKRDDELLVDKHNEALKVMPVLFDKNGYEVTVCDPVYANYQWLPDTSIYDEYEDINTFVTSGAFSDPKIKEITVENRHRNFFCFSLMKTMPLFIQPVLYDNGAYIQSKVNYESVISRPVQYVEEGSSTKAEGISSAFLEPYNVIANLSNITKISDDGTNTFMMMVNNATHEPVLLQKPDYVPTEKIDNTEYDAVAGGTITVDGKILYNWNHTQKIHYQSNMAVMLKLGEWFDYMREQGVYDNTKIILVSDHGTANEHFEGMSREGVDLTKYACLLMVKDFESEEYVASEEFMTNADVPTLAFEDCIDDPVNPFTNKPINSDEKTAHDQFVIMSNVWDVNQNNGKTFLPSEWLKVKNNIWNKDNWTFNHEETVLDEHSFKGK